jgi:hypothetical protein
MFDFAKAMPVPRGCGKREPGGVYVECGLHREGGRPLETFLIDPPLPLPEGKGKRELVNKPQLWVRTMQHDPTDPASVEVVMHPGTHQPIVDLLIWIGAEYYPYVSDFIEEVAHFGASRKLNPHLDLSALTQYSRMILIHPHARNTLWDQQQSPRLCRKEVPGHACLDQDNDGEQEDEETRCGEPPALPRTERHQPPQHGPCLFKCYDLIPCEAASLPPDPADPAPSLCIREIGSTCYPYEPTDESAQGLEPGIFAALPITGFALIRRDDGSVQERARARIEAALAQHGKEIALPFYTPDC